jgi:sugar lactone lactonase YvrE
VNKQLAFKIARVDGPRSQLGEGPCWDAATQSLLWVDILGKAIHRHWPMAQTTTTHSMPTVVSAVCPSQSGGFVLLLEDGFWQADSQMENLEPIASVHDSNGLLRMNDGKVDPSGRFWGGSMAYDGRPGKGSLHVLEGRDVTTVLSDLGISNGLDWSPDGHSFYFVDSLTRCLWVFDFDASSGRVSNRRTLIKFEESFGLPDGLTVDAEGCIWVAGWDGWRVQRYSPYGDYLGLVDVPAARVTSCAFGGNDLTDLYITTATVGLTEDELELQPEAGSLFVARVNAKGKEATVFGKA